MKMYFQQYKPSQAQYTLGIAGLIVALISVVIIVLFCYKIYGIGSSDYILAIKAIGPGLIVAIAFCLKKCWSLLKM